MTADERQFDIVGFGEVLVLDEGGQMNHQATLATTVVDPVGAGDAFAGSYLAARLSGFGPRSASWLGSAFAAAVVAAPGDTAGLPSPEQVVELLTQARQLEGSVS